MHDIAAPGDRQGARRGDASEPAANVGRAHGDARPFRARRRAVGGGRITSGCRAGSGLDLSIANPALRQFARAVDRVRPAEPRRATHP
jgi:hypothetical protein